MIRGTFVSDEDLERLQKKVLFEAEAIETREQLNQVRGKYLLLKDMSGLFPNNVYIKKISIVLATKREAIKK